MTPLILLKHSLPEIDPQRPAAEWRLSPEGRARCHGLAAAVRPYSPAQIFSSHEPKAIETAQLLAEELGLPHEPAEGLHEHDRRHLRWAERDQFEAAVKQFFAEPGALVMGSETADQAHARFAQAVDGLINAHPRQTLAIVAHGTVITLLVSRLVGLAPFPLWQRLGLPSLVVLDESRLLTVVESVASP